MKMYDKNGKMTIITRAIFDSNMERLRAGDDALVIALSLHEQVKLIEYNGAFVDEYGNKTQWYWQSFKRGWYHWMWRMDQPRITLKMDTLGATTGRMSREYYDFPIYSKRSGPIALGSTVVS